MKTLLYQNRKFLKKVKPHITEECKKMAAKATASLLAMRANQEELVSDAVVYEEDDLDAALQLLLVDRNQDPPKAAAGAAQEAATVEINDDDSTSESGSK